MRIRVLAAALVAIVLSFAITPGASAGQDGLEYFQVVSRNLGFIAAVLNVALWGVLMKTGTAIAHGFYIMLPQSTTVWTLVNLLGIGSHFLCLGIWLWALRYEMRLIHSLRDSAYGIP